MFSNMLGMIDAVYQLGDKATIGNVQKMNPHMTRGQVERAMKGLEGEGYLEHAVKPYGCTGKKVYNVTNLCITNIYSIANVMGAAD